MIRLLGTLRKVRLLRALLLKAARSLTVGASTENGGIEWPSGPSVVTDLPVGLTNIANTCYLNSLLQVRVI